MKSKLTKGILLLFTITLLTSCNLGMFNGVKGDRNVVTNDRKLNDDFTAIKVSTGLNVYVTQGDKNEVIIEADENLHDIIMTEVEDGVLRIYSEKSIWGEKAAKVHVTVKNLEELDATSGSEVTSTNEIIATNFKVSTTSGAEVDFKVNSTNVESSATSGSELKLFGKTVNHTSSATSGATIDGYNLKSENAYVSVTSGADIYIYASVKIEANATSGGDIDFKGNPKQTKNSSSSGGSVSKI